MPKKSAVSFLLKFTSILILVAGIAAGIIIFVFLSPKRPMITVTLIGILVIIASLIICLFMLGIAKIIDSLRQQQHTLEQIVETLREQQMSSPKDSELEEVLPEF